MAVHSYFNSNCYCYSIILFSSQPILFIITTTEIAVIVLKQFSLSPTFLLQSFEQLFYQQEEEEESCLVLREAL
jgi:hypothetical protein